MELVTITFFIYLNFIAVYSIRNARIHTHVTWSTCYCASLGSRFTSLHREIHTEGEDMDPELSEEEFPHDNP
jgi:hypothetical protein